MRMPSCMILLSAALGCGSVVSEHEEDRAPPEADRAPPPSAAREPDEDFTQALRRGAPGLDLKEDSGSSMVFHRRVPRSQLDGDGVPEWTREQLREQFLIARDHRPLEDTAHAGFSRRPPFLYPEDGCFARAEAMIQEIGLSSEPPWKVFVFGNLALSTANAPAGRVTWWYHVAPVVRVEGELWVIDPGIEPSAPLLLDAWIARQVPPGGERFVALTLCSDHAYGPDGECDPSAGPGARAERDHQRYLELEWDRQIELGRDPWRVLGDEPPWLHQQNPGASP